MNMNAGVEVLLAEPRGFCAGVDRAIEIVERALAKFGAPIYVRHEIVHNTYVVNDLKAKGAIFIEALDDVPKGATLVFSAHGVSRAVQQEAAARGATLICSLHQVDLALAHFPRIVALRAGRIAFDLPRAQVTPQMIAELYQGEPSTPAPAPAALPEADAMLVKPGAGACL